MPRRTVTSSWTSTCRDNFRGDVQGRDGNCVLTGVPVYICDAAHLPHSKYDTAWDSCTTLSSLTISSAAVYRDIHHTDVETPVATTTLYKTSAMFVMVCSCYQDYIVHQVKISHS